MEMKGLLIAELRFYMRCATSKQTSLRHSRLPTGWLFWEFCGLPYGHVLFVSDQAYLLPLSCSYLSVAGCLKTGEFTRSCLLLCSVHLLVRVTFLGNTLCPMESGLATSLWKSAHSNLLQTSLMFFTVPGILLFGLFVFQRRLPSNRCGESAHWQSTCLSVCCVYDCYILSSQNPLCPLIIFFY